jgi:hypothetical protein
MSLFDVIKYPISDVPTNDELCAIPPIVFLDWRDWVKANCNKKWYKPGLSTIKLRLMLAEYDAEGDGT